MSAKRSLAGKFEQMEAEPQQQQQQTQPFPNRDVWGLQEKTERTRAFVGLDLYRDMWSYRLRLRILRPLRRDRHVAMGVITGFRYC